MLLASLPLGAMDWSAVCNCGILLSYLLSDILEHFDSMYRSAHKIIVLLAHVVSILGFENQGGCRGLK